MIHWLTMLSLLAIPALVGCGGDDGDEEELEIVGTYYDGFSSHAVTGTTWTMTATGIATSLFHITSFSNSDDFLVAENDANNEWGAGKFSRFDWTHDGAELYMCQIAFDAASQAEAAAATGADRTDLTDKGCAGFPWSKLTPKT